MIIKVITKFCYLFYTVEAPLTACFFRVREMSDLYQDAI